MPQICSFVLCPIAQRSNKHHFNSYHSTICINLVTQEVAPNLFFYPPSKKIIVATGYLPVRCGILDFPVWRVLVDSKVLHFKCWLYNKWKTKMGTLQKWGHGCPSAAIDFRAFIISGSSRRLLGCRQSCDSIILLTRYTKFCRSVLYYNYHTEYWRHIWLSWCFVWIIHEQCYVFYNHSREILL